MMPLEELLAQPSSPAPPPPEPAGPARTGNYYEDIHDEPEWERRRLMAGGRLHVVPPPQNDSEKGSLAARETFTGEEELPTLNVTERIRQAQNRLAEEYRNRQAIEQIGGSC